jgi:son of sevenless-like protein
MFGEDDEDMLLVEEEPARTRAKDLTYEQVVKDLILEEKQYLRDTNMIIKVFREPFVKLFPKSQVN